jgi:hypothetical protein
MAPQFDRALRDLLRAAGCTLVRQGRGSHEIWHSPVTKRNCAVPVGTASRHTRQCDPASGRTAQGFLTFAQGKQKQPGLATRPFKTDPR